MRNILVLATVTLGTLSLNAQNTTMFVHTTDGNVTSTDIAKVDKITSTDAEYNLNADKDRILEYNELNWPEDRLLPLFLPPASIVRAFDMNEAKLNEQERVMFCVMQGIVNRFALFFREQIGVTSTHSSIQPQRGT